MKATLRYSFFIAAACGLSACGGGGDGGGDSEVVTPVVVPAVPALALEKSSYLPGETINLAGMGASAPKNAALVFSDGQRIDLPVQASGNVIVPVLSSDLFAKTARLSVTSGTDTLQSGDIRIQPIPVSTSKPGISTLIYLDATIANLGQSIDELVTISGDSASPEAAEITRYRDTLVQLRDAVMKAQSGTAVEMSAPGAKTPLFLDSQQLQILDQYVLSLLSASSRLSASSAPLKAALPGAPMKFSITSLNCSGLADAADRAWCANMRTQIANDLIINYAGMAGTAGGMVAGALAALAAAGIAATATPALILGAASIGLMVVANGVGAGVQGASAYGTGTSQGTNVRDNINNLIAIGRDLATSQLAKALPNGGSALVSELNGAVTGAAADKFFDKVDKVVADNTASVPSCTAQANSGGQGSFASRYDFSVPRALVLTYDAFTVPDQFSVFDASGELGSTPGLISGTGSVRVASTSRYVTVKVNAPNSQTAWNYSISCQ